MIKESIHVEAAPAKHPQIADYTSFSKISTEPFKI